MLDVIQKITIIIRNISISAFFIYGIIFLINVSTTINSIQSDISKTNSLITTEIPIIRQDLISTTNETLSKIDKRIISIESNLFKRVDTIESKTFLSMERINGNLDKITQESILLSQDYRTIPKNVSSILTPINTRMDCKYNDTCWPNLFSDVLIDTRNTARVATNSFMTINKEVPKLTSEVNRVSTSFSNGVPIILDNTTKITNNIDRLTKPKWYDRILGIGANATLVYYNVTRR